MNNNNIIGMDLGDKFHIAVIFNANGDELGIFKVNNTKTQISNFFKSYKGSTVAMEAGTHSPWISRILDQIGCRVYVGNPRKLRFIWGRDDKTDERDARMLGMVCRIEPRLLSPIRHRSSQAQADLMMIKSREMLVEARTKLINHARGVVKSNGKRLPRCSTDSFVKRCSNHVPVELWPSLEAVFNVITQLSEQIHELDSKINKLCKQYSETSYLQQVPGVGPVTALCYILTIDDPARFTKSRQLGPFIGLTPRCDQSGKTDKQLRITKSGDKYLRSLLVSCAHYIMGPFGPDSHLRSYGLRICERGGKNAKKRAAVAVARKLAVLLHRLWISESAYEPFYGSVQEKAA